MSECVLRSVLAGKRTSSRLLFIWSSSRNKRETETILSFGGRSAQRSATNADRRCATTPNCCCRLTLKESVSASAYLSIIIHLICFCYPAILIRPSPRISIEFFRNRICGLFLKKGSSVKCFKENQLQTNNRKFIGESETGIVIVSS